ncbi:MAG: non-canonical purine NTP pyrophosphatase [Limosilactobacillus sp.]|uniref:non-canonical purine NTP pyrophosphatase n=1 Tax=Limosilactobacillus sp. TaxID=2773925 RepID=UPI0025B88A65|nr:non-canonical purine NTP pyrophosphatase [Limosilactobacillus sp.]MCI1974866.1 non-canonical purine NTP pyrophosphatase [Limosilactobacillus sp.]MCI2031092.1 non-canonical purine NTP pyrophosphatase [Limosilactobacillus sp.]
MQFVIASHNQDKINELQRIFRTCHHDAVPYTELLSKKVFPAEGDTSYMENASQKALFISKYLNRYLVIADDSGLFLTAHPNILGVRTARDLVNFPTPHEYAEYIIQLVHGRNRAFKMQTSIACAYHGRILKVTNGTLEGQIAITERGTAGEGFSQILIPENSTKTLAQMTFAERYPYLTRARAAEGLIQWLKENNNQY